MKLLTFEDLPIVDGLTLGRLDYEVYREYVDLKTGAAYRIDAPIGFYHRAGGTTHRVVTADGVVHCA